MPSNNKAELREDGCHDNWTTTVWRIIAKFIMPGSYLLGTAAGLFLQKKHLTFTEYQTIEAKEPLAIAEPELYTVLGHLRSLGPDEGATSRTPVTLTCPSPPEAEAPTSPRPSTLKKNSTPRVTANTKRNGYLMLTLDGSDTDRRPRPGGAASLRGSGYSSLS